MSAIARPPTVKGWCPGAFRPMESGDGLLVRVRVTGGVVPAATFAALGGLARRYGNGLIDLSQRANLQIRGVRPATLDPLVAGLDALALLDADPAAESVRNVIAPPLAGLDDTAHADGGALVRMLEDRLSKERDLHALPDKFGFLVDDGGRVPLDDVVADIRLVAGPGGITISLGGDAASAAPVALASENDAAETALMFARVFLELRDRTGARRMRVLLTDIGTEAIRAAAGLAATPPPPAAAARSRPNLLGRGEGWTGIGAPFGRLSAVQMDRIAERAESEIRLTPWRLVLLPGAQVDALAALGKAGLLVDPDDPRQVVVACPGAPDCASASVDTRTAAARLALLLAGRSGVALHVSGCPKGCARPAATAVTLTGRDGLFDLVLNGRADAAPLLHGLDLDAAGKVVADALSRSKDPR